MNTNIKSKLALVFLGYLTLIFTLQIYPNDSFNSFFNHYDKIIFCGVVLIPFAVGSIIYASGKKELGSIFLQNTFYLFVVLLFSFWFKF